MGIVLLAYGNGDTKRISAYLHNCVANKAIILPVLPCGHDIKTITELERLSREVDVIAMVRLMKRCVPEFKSENSKFKELD